MISAKIKLYDIAKCCYFRRNSSKAKFGNVEEVLDQLNEWASSKESEFVAAHDRLS